MMLRAMLLLALAAQAQAQTTIVYSRSDGAQALIAMRLARVYGPVRIDLAVQPGAQWRAAMADAICSARLVLVLWSARAAASIEVAHELQTARDCAAPVVPVLLDSTPLPDGLAGVQGVDWR